MVNHYDIDFVVLWVDGNDPKWLEKYSKYSKKKNNVRFRDYGTFKYWFRSVEQYASWVHKIYLVTDQQIPEWLNLKNSKIQIIDHKEIIPSKYLPVFNSNAIDMNLYKIPGLAEHFVYFNDDFFLNKKVSPSDFFDNNGLPKDSAVQNAIMPVENFDHISVNNMSLVNNTFNKYSVIKKNWNKFFNFRYGYKNILSILLLPWPRFTRFMDPHIPISFRKSEFKNVMEKFSKQKNQTLNNRFRSKDDISLWLVRYFQLATGEFKPRSTKFGKMYKFSDIKNIEEEILKQKHKCFCVNDVDLSDSEFNRNSEILIDCFELKLPQKSTFEI